MRRRGLVSALAGGAVFAGSLVLAGSAVLASGPAAAAPPVPVRPSATVTAALSSARTAARPVQLALSFRTALVCGRPLGPTTITFPAVVHVPAAIPPAAVLVDGRPAGRVTVAGPLVRVTSLTPTGMMCHSVALGPMAITFTKAAGIGNPAHAGTFAIGVRRGHRTLHGRLTIVG
jgi:hypothetical protein